MSLAEGSKSYYADANVYERFSRAEDTLERVTAFLGERIVGKDVIDIGCGTGKYVTLHSRLARSYVGVDISPEQLRIARNKTSDAKLVCSRAEETGLRSSVCDVVIATWVIGTIQSVERRSQVVDEAKRLVRKNGSIFLVENDVGGEFEYIRGRFPDIRRTKEYNDWLEYEMGFVPVEKCNTFFGFDSVDEAQKIIGSIWGEDAAEKVVRKNIEHKIVIFHQVV